MEIRVFGPPELIAEVNYICSDPLVPLPILLEEWIGRFNEDRRSNINWEIPILGPPSVGTERSELVVLVDDHLHQEFSAHCSAANWACNDVLLGILHHCVNIKRQEDRALFNVPTSSVLVKVDPGELHLPPSRQDGPNSSRYRDQIDQFGSRSDWSSPIEVWEGKEGHLLICNGTTRAARAYWHIHLPKIEVLITERFPHADYSQYSRIRDVPPVT